MAKAGAANSSFARIVTAVRNVGKETIRFSPHNLDVPDYRPFTITAANGDERKITSTYIGFAASTANPWSERLLPEVEIKPGGIVFLGHYHYGFWFDLLLPEGT